MYYFKNKSILSIQPQTFHEMNCINCWSPVNEMHGADSCFPQRFKVITSKKLQQVSSIRWNFLFQRKYMKLNSLHVPILPFFPFVGWKCQTTA